MLILLWKCDILLAILLFNKYNFFLLIMFWWLLKSSKHHIGSCILVQTLTQRHGCLIQWLLGGWLAHNFIVSFSGWENNLVAFTNWVVHSHKSVKFSFFCTLNNFFVSLVNVFFVVLDTFAVLMTTCLVIAKCLLHYITRIACLWNAYIS